ncbi:MAG: acyclic terpene utilization AtuA family protein, partial [Gammaproteobacteria bacterium]
YENANPFELHEPGGYLDVHDARYAALDERRVRVTGSRWVPAENYTVKLEAARVVGYQATVLVLLRDAHYVANAREWVAKLNTFLVEHIDAVMDLREGDYALEFRLIGVDATLGALETAAVTPAEVGVLCIITAANQALATEIACLANPWLLHFPLRADEELPTFAFAHSPAHCERGALYEFALHHVMQLEDPMAAFRLEVHEVGG